MNIISRIVLMVPVRYWMRALAIWLAIGAIALFALSAKLFIVDGRFALAAYGMLCMCLVVVLGSTLYRFLDFCIQAYQSGISATPIDEYPRNNRM